MFNSRCARPLARCLRPDRPRTKPRHAGRLLASELLEDRRLLSSYSLDSVSAIQWLHFPDGSEGDTRFVESVAVEHDVESLQTLVPGLPLQGSYDDPADGPDLQPFVIGSERQAIIISKVTGTARMPCRSSLAPRIRCTSTLAC